MNLALVLIVPLFALALLAAPLVPVYRGVTTGKKAKRSVIANLCAFAGVCVLACLLYTSRCV